MSDLPTPENSACCVPGSEQRHGEQRHGEQRYSEQRPCCACAPSGFAECRLEIPLLALPGGEFQMGEDRPDIARASDGEGPVRVARVAAFKIGITTVTNDQFAAFVTATHYVTEAEHFGWSYVFHKHLSAKAKKAARGSAGTAPWWIGVDGACWKHPEGPGSHWKNRAEFPAVHISWNDAQAFCRWSQTRLPTETEWEYAARGGLERKIFPWGDDLVPKGKNGKPQHRMNVWQGKFPDFDSGADGYTGTAPARSFAPNNFGLYNITGNVWQWCEEWFDAAQQNKAMRGGSFLCHASYCNRYRCAARTGNTPDSTSGNCGFRVAQSV